MYIYLKRMKVAHGKGNGGKQTYVQLYIAATMECKFHAVIEAKKTCNKISWRLLIAIWNSPRV